MTKINKWINEIDVQLGIKINKNQAEAILKEWCKLPEVAKAEILQVSADNWLNPDYEKLFNKQNGV